MTCHEAHLLAPRCSRWSPARRTPTTRRCRAATSAPARRRTRRRTSAAARNFDEAYKALPMPEIAFSAAQAYRRLYRVEPKPEYVRAPIELYKLYLDDVKTGGRVGDAADNLAEMEHELDKLEAAGVKSTPVGGRSTRGSASTSASPIRATAEPARSARSARPPAMRRQRPASRRSTASRSSRSRSSRSSQRARHRGRRRRLLSRREEDGRGRRPSTLVDVELRPKPAKVTVDDRGGRADPRRRPPVATTPTARSRSPPGKHLVTILRSGREPFARELTSMRGASTDPVRAAREDRAPPRGAVGARRCGRARRGRGRRPGSSRCVRGLPRASSRRRSRWAIAARRGRSSTTMSVQSRDRFVTCDLDARRGRGRDWSRWGASLFFETPTAEGATSHLAGLDPVVVGACFAFWAPAKARL